MSNLTIYHNPRCSKSRGALKILEEKGLSPDVRYYLKEALSEEELKFLLNKLGIRAEDLVRKGEKLYKEQYKGKTLSEAEWIHVLTEHPRLIERPIVIKGNKAVIGRPPEKVMELI